jgi:ABC-2 type transport system permease protein
MTHPTGHEATAPAAPAAIAAPEAPVSPSANAWRAFSALVRKDLRLYFANRRALVMGLLAPIVIAAFFGSLFDNRREQVSRIPVALSDLDHSALTQGLVAALRTDAAITLSELPAAEAAQAVVEGRQRVAIVLPAGLGEAAPRALFGAGARPEIALHYDPSQAMALPVVKGLLAQHLMAQVGQAGLGGGAAGAAGAAGAFKLPFTTRESAATARSGQEYNSYAHSFAGMGVQFILFLGIEFGVGLLLMRRQGLWQRLRAAPITRGLLLGSRIASAALIAFGLMLAIFAVAIAAFGVRIQGSVAGFIGVALAFALLTASFGLLIAALGKTPEATRGLAIFATLVMVMLGGAWVPSFLFPEWLQTVSLAVPTRWAVDGLDAMTWRGLGVGAAIAPIGAMLAFAAAFTGLAIWRFDWQED